MSLLEGLYTGALHGVRLALPLVARGEGKLARGVRGRRGALARLEGWGREHRDHSRPLIWFHAPSVGEGLQARAVMEEVRRTLPEAQLAYTHFSPSAESLARSVPADVADYLPLDLPGFVRRLFDALVPSLVAFSKTEIWPNLTREAERRGVPVVLLSATLPESSSRLGPLARALLAPSHRRLARVAAISPADAERFAALAVRPERTFIMGDARFDQVWNRVRHPGAGERIVEALGDISRLTLVAGSTWPDDEDRLVAAYARLLRAARDGRDRLRLVIVPHEPTPAHLERLGRSLTDQGLLAVTLTQWLAEREQPPSAAAIEGRPAAEAAAEIVIVDRVGILGDLYRIADIAYVGGGFGRGGLHSVLEPAAFGVPVVFGPRYDNSREAAELIVEGGAASVSGVDELTATLEGWTSLDPTARKAAGADARRYVERNLGAASKGARLIADLVRSHRPAAAPAPPDHDPPPPSAGPSETGHSGRPLPAY